MGWVANDFGGGNGNEQGSGEGIGGWENNWGGLCMFQGGGNGGEWRKEWEGKMGRVGVGSVVNVGGDGRRMGGVGEWMGWENEWGKLHMLPGGREGRGIDRGIDRGIWKENGQGGKLIGVGCTFR